MLGYRALAALLTFALVRRPTQAWVGTALFAGSSAVSLVALDTRSCIRLRNAAIPNLGQLTPVGTPVTIP